MKQYNKERRVNYICIVCGLPAMFKLNLMDVRQSFVVMGTYCHEHALQQCDAEKNAITRFMQAKEKQY